MNSILAASHSLSQVPCELNQCPQVIERHKVTVAQLDIGDQEDLDSAQMLPSPRTQLSTPKQSRECSTTYTLVCGCKPASTDYYSEDLEVKTEPICSRSPAHDRRPVPTPRPNLANLLLRNSQTKRTLTDVHAFTKGTDIYQ